jgi:hypothetical protein
MCRHGYRKYVCGIHTQDLFHDNCSDTHLSDHIIERYDIDDFHQRSILEGGTGLRNLSSKTVIGPVLAIAPENMSRKNASGSVIRSNQAQAPNSWLRESYYAFGDICPVTFRNLAPLLNLPPVSKVAGALESRNTMTGSVGLEIGPTPSNSSKSPNSRFSSPIRRIERRVCPIVTCRTISKFTPRTRWTPGVKGRFRSNSINIHEYPKWTEYAAAGDILLENDLELNEDTEESMLEANNLIDSWNFRRNIRKRQLISKIQGAGYEKIDKIRRLEILDALWREKGGENEVGNCDETDGEQGSHTTRNKIGREDLQLEANKRSRMQVAGDTDARMIESTQQLSEAGHTTMSQNDGMFFEDAPLYVRPVILPETIWKVSESITGLMLPAPIEQIPWLRIQGEQPKEQRNRLQEQYDYNGMYLCQRKLRDIEQVCIGQAKNGTWDEVLGLLEPGLETEHRQRLQQVLHEQVHSIVLSIRGGKNPRSSADNHILKSSQNAVGDIYTCHGVTQKEQKSKYISPSMPICCEPQGLTTLATMNDKQVDSSIWPRIQRCGVSNLHQMNVQWVQNFSTVINLDSGQGILTDNPGYETQKISAEWLVEEYPRQKKQVRFAESNRRKDFSASENSQGYIEWKFEGGDAVPLKDAHQPKSQRLFNHNQDHVLLATDGGEHRCLELEYKADEDLNLYYSDSSNSSIDGDDEKEAGDCIAVYQGDLAEFGVDNDNCQADDSSDEEGKSSSDNKSTIQDIEKSASSPGIKEGGRKLNPRKTLLEGGEGKMEVDDRMRDMDSNDENGTEVDKRAREFLVGRNEGVGQYPRDAHVKSNEEKGADRIKDRSVMHKAVKGSCGKVRSGENEIDILKNEVYLATQNQQDSVKGKNGKETEGNKIKNAAPVPLAKCWHQESTDVRKDKLGYVEATLARDGQSPEVVELHARKWRSVETTSKLNERRRAKRAARVNEKLLNPLVRPPEIQRLPLYDRWEWEDIRTEMEERRRVLLAHFETRRRTRTMGDFLGAHRDWTNSSVPRLRVHDGMGVGGWLGASQSKTSPVPAASHTMAAECGNSEKPQNSPANADLLILVEDVSTKSDRGRKRWIRRNKRISRAGVSHNGEGLSKQVALPKTPIEMPHRFSHNVHGPNMSEFEPFSNPRNPVGALVPAKGEQRG